MTYPNLAQSFAAQHDRRLTQIVYESVQDGLWPWVPGRIALYMDETLNGRYFSIKIEQFPNLIFQTQVDWQLSDPTTMVLSIAEKAFKFYRYREALPVDDHIILGEE